MAISKDKKKELIDQYVSDLKAAQNVVIVQQTGICVNTSSDVRKQVLGAEGKFNVVRKRLFMRALAVAGYEIVDIEKLEGPIGVLYATSDEYGPLKVVNKFAKEFVKDKSESSFKFLGAWYDKKWQDGAYVTELANIPSKEELISKLAYLFNYPLQSFACVVNEVAKKQAV
ncbi:MAG: 50S ribosomal protein L10 [Candidatus Peribacteria bacterium]|jgi:large subunit ribosomal protein L10|nr:50S ribosomal protein L10 [Candidatus Peribacteria bacterium]